MEIEKRVKELEELIKNQSKIIEQQAKEINNLKEKVKELEVADPKKPSFIKDPIKTRPHKPGQKKGHQGNSRPLPQEVDEEVEIKYNRCPDCNTKLKTTEVRERYVEDIIFPKKVVKKYNIHRCWCPKCKEVKTPKPKDALPKCRFGLTLMLFVCFQKFGLLLTINKIQRELVTYFNLEVSQGEISQIITKLGKLFNGEFEELKHEMRNLAVSYTDETGWRSKGQNKWLWTFINEKIALYVIDKSRGHEVALEVLGKDYSGIVSSDRYCTYNTLEKATNCKQQKCWTHILRNARDLAKLYEEAKYVHKRLKQIYKSARNGESKEKLLHWIDLVAENRKRCKSTEVKKFVNSICRKHRDNLFRFVDNPEVESTNNRAERGLRPLVVMRKISGGNRSENGERATEVMCSVINSWQLQDRNFFQEGTAILQNQFL